MLNPEQLKAVIGGLVFYLIVMILAYKCSKKKDDE